MGNPQLWATCPRFSHPHSKFVPYVQSELTLFQSKNIALCPVTTGPWKCLTFLHLFYKPLRIKRLQWGLLGAFSRLHNSNSLGLSSQERSCTPLSIFTALLWTCCNKPMCWRFLSWTQCSRWGLTRGSGTSPSYPSTPHTEKASWGIPTRIEQTCLTDWRI